MDKNNILELLVIKEYKKIIIPMLKKSYPSIPMEFMEYAVDNIITEYLKDEKGLLDNSYKKKQLETSLVQMTEYILSKEPIITSGGIIFRKRGEVVNPIMRMIETFMQNRNINKSKMFKYARGSELYERYNLSQVLDKLDANGLYGCIGASTCIYYNLYTATAITMQGQLSISIAAMCFESFLANNVKFRCLDEIIIYIYNILSEDRKFNDKDILDRDIDICQTFEYIMNTCGNEYMPTENDCKIIWDILVQCNQEELNRLFYKNNLFAFMDNKRMDKAIKILLTKLDKPYLNPNKPPKEILPELDGLWDLIEEYVFYNYGYIDSIERLKFLPRACTLEVDTDSNFVYLNPWYKYILDKVYDLPMDIKYMKLDVIEVLDDIELENSLPVVEFLEPEYDYNFYTDEIIELEKTINPIHIPPQDGLRFSIINIMAFILDKLISSAMIRYTKSCNSYEKDRECLMIMKNEYMIKSLLKTESMRSYATMTELQEGRYLGNVLDIKGLGLDKTTLNDTSKKKLQRILAEDILNAEEISQIKVIKKLILMEKDIIKSLSEGSKEYYKPVNIKSMYVYDDPMRIQGIKASIVWNELRDPSLEGIDLEKRNTIDIVRININSKNIDHLKEKDTELYNKLIELLKEDSFKKGITAIAIPINVKTPEWVIEFIDYKTIINDNLTTFKKPLDCIGLELVGGHVNYTNILNI